MNPGESPVTPLPLRERITDLYIIIMLTVFPLFPGVSGYSDITFSKFVVFLAAAGLWLAALAVSALIERPRPAAPAAAQIAAAVFLAVCILSWLLSPDRAESFLGAGRYDGLLSTALYILSFLGISAFTRPKPVHLYAFALSMTLCLLIAVLQLFGLNPLRLFPDGLCYYDSGLLYSGTFLGTIGNTNILDAVLCIALPLMFSLFVCGRSGLLLIPAALGAFVLTEAGGDGAAVALLVFCLFAMPILLTDLRRVRRALRGGAAVLAAIAATLAYAPLYSDSVLTPALRFSSAAAAVLTAALLFPGLSLLPLRGFAPSGQTLRRFFSCLSAAAVLLGLAALLFIPWQSGTLYELSRMLHGEFDDSFGSSRILIWRKCLDLVPARPLLGGGPGTLALHLDIEFSRFVPETGAALHSYVDNAHSVYLGYLSNIGVLGLAAYLGLLVTAAVSALRRRQAHYSVLALALFCASVHALFGLGLFLSEAIFWITLGLLCSSKG